MTNLSLPFEGWDERKDIRPEQASTHRAFGIVNGALDLGRVPNGVKPSLDKSIGPAVEEVLALLMETVEWLRERGLSATEIQQGFNRQKRRVLTENRKLKYSTLERDAIELPSNPRNLKTERVPNL